MLRYGFRFGGSKIERRRSQGRERERERARASSGEGGKKKRARTRGIRSREQERRMYYRRVSKDGTMEAKTETSLTGSRLPPQEGPRAPRRQKLYLAASSRLTLLRYIYRRVVLYTYTFISNPPVEHPFFWATDRRYFERESPPRCLLQLGSKTDEKGKQCFYMRRKLGFPISESF